MNHTKVLDPDVAGRKAAGVVQVRPRCSRDECWCPHIVAIVRLMTLIDCRLGEVVSLERDWIRGKCIHLPDWKSGHHTV